VKNRFKMRIIVPLFIIISCTAIAQSINAGTEVPRDTFFTVKSAFRKEHAKYPFIRIVQPQFPKGVAEERNLVYISYGDRQLHLELFYLAERTDKAFPAVLLVHGGGWRSGDRAHQIPLALQLAARGYVTAAVEYRLSPEALYPAAVHDLKAAVRWIRANASKYDIDASRIAILGCSSGGQLAVLIGNTNGMAKFEGYGDNANYSSDVQAIVDIDGILDFTSVEARKYEDDPKKQPSSAGAWFRGSYNQKPDLWKEASPLYYVTEKSPPILFVNSSIPRFHVGRDEMVKKLEQFNIYYEIHTIPNTPHPFWLFHPWFEETVEQVTNFLDKTLKEKVQ
jgi:acetyl esterase/lipase